MSEKPSFKEKFKSWGKAPYIYAGVFVAGIASVGVMNAFFSYTNEMEFCTSCHSMKINLEEYKETIHYKNSMGVRATCSDCHVPKEFGPKLYAKIIAAKDVYHEFLGDFAVSDEIKNDPVKYKEHYEKHRLAMAEAVWAKMKASDSATCRTCHNYDAMDYDKQGKTAVRRHSTAIEKGKTCIDCHKGIAHHMPAGAD
jgi:nitrate/TMAO reductase-like tetraheme cytochrome c subunit